MLKNLLKATILAGAAYLSGCAASGPEFTNIAEPPADKSQIYIYRPWAFTAGGVGLPILHNGEQLPYPLHNKGYLHYLAQAGHHEIHVNANGLIDRKLQLYTKPGETYFIKLTIQNYFAVMGTRLLLVDKDTALKEIQNYKLSTTGNSLDASTQDSAPIMQGAAKAAQPISKNNNALIADEIRKLSALRNEGTITNEEFEDRKSKLLSL
ncbi:DUF2846 domain-containing protein [Pseudomonas xionganensis]|uniref:DUF2846 domain-containing protein n=1 Tax=Pseudomonas xionganensis TaxID=2654845 RepID=A0A6I4KRI5_9PSED|nr:DUF2846 domain-containing protein [Pseudomonas xionganensis]MVW74261.1 DUF2846 domain-containing protein [Pseudomonas xionganensis]